MTKYLQICHVFGSAAKCLLIGLKSLLIVRNISWEEEPSRAEFSLKLKFTGTPESVNSSNVKDLQKAIIVTSLLPVKLHTSFSYDKRKGDS